MEVVQNVLFGLFLVIMGLGLVCTIGEGVQLKSYQKKINIYRRMFFPAPQSKFSKN